MKGAYNKAILRTPTYALLGDTTA